MQERPHKEETSQSKKKSGVKKLVLKVLQLILGLLVLNSVTIICALAFMYFDFYRTQQVEHRSQHLNAMWVRHQWVGDNKKPEDYQALAQSLRQRQITDIYAHVGPLNKDGLIEPEKYLYATQFVKAMKQAYPELRVQAWIGQVEKRGGGPLDLNRTEVRHNIVQTSQIFLDLGFDGIHYNIEPIYSGDQRILTLLKDTKQLTSTRSATLSLATDELAPFWGAEKIVQQLRTQAAFWDEAYYQAVAEPVDQIAVMMYDTSLTEPWLFGQLVKWETRHLVEIIGDKAVLFMGVPTYEDERLSFHPEAENMDSGLRGIQQGLQPFSSDQLKNFGVAIYAEWTTSDEEWQTYEREWLKKTDGDNAE